MNNTKVLAFPPSATYTVEQALASASQASLSDVLVIGFDETGDLYVRSSRMSRADALWLLEKARDHTLRA